MVRRRWVLGWTFVILSAAHACGGEGPRVVEHSKSRPRAGRGLSTEVYQPTELEKERTEGWTDEELGSGSPEAGLDGAAGSRVSWFGIVREVEEDKEADRTRLLIEMKFFDGLADTHQQIVSIFGAGDFRATVPGIGHKIKRLELVRVYGTLIEGDGELPQVEAEYVRCWDWGQFAFMPYGKDRSNERWVKLRKVAPDDIYDSRPDDAYYVTRLGER